jgi:EpsI family protein
MKPLAPWRTLLPVALSMLMTAVLLHARTTREAVPLRMSFSAFPTQIEDWSGTDIPLLPQERKILGNGDFLLRDYTRGDRSPVNLYLAYYPSQRSGDAIHSPRNCLPGAGWSPLEAGRIRIAGSDGISITVNRYIVAKGSERMLVLYWYQSHGRVTASEYSAKILLVADSIRTNRSDGGLVRIMSSYQEGQEANAESQVLELARRILPRLSAYIPR